MRRALYIILPLLAIIALLAWLNRPQPLAVATTTVASGIVESTVANTRAGTVKACRRARLAPTIGGQVVALNVVQGQVVESGELLMQFWNEDLAAQVTVAESELRAATTRAREACLGAELAERELHRLEPLHRQGLVSDEALDRAESAAQSRRAACDSAESAVQAARDRITLARANLKRTELRAPFDGIVAEVTGELGEFVTPSPPGIPTPPAVDLIERDCLVVTAPLDEVDSPAVRVGMPARISIDAIPGRSFAGTVRRIAPYAQDYERQARVVEVEVEFDDPPRDHHLLPGYSADAEIILDRRDDALRIPTEALIEGARVWVVDDGRLASRRVETGLSNWVWTEVRAGLSAGDRIVTSLDRPGMREGQRVDATDR